MNENGDWSKATMEDGSESFDQEGKTKAIFTIETDSNEDDPGEGEEYELAVSIHPAGNNTPEIKSITTYFEAIGIL